MEKQPLILQLNFPFCYHQCAYCSVPSCKYDIPTMHRYAEAMVQELESLGPDMEDYQVAAISMEGGSPGLMAPANLQAVLRAAKKNLSMADEPFISLQTMPGQYSRSLLDRLRDTGVNHWIFSIPTTVDRLHYLLELPYNPDAVTMADTVLRNFHLHDVSFELLYGIPGQTAHEFLSDLERMLVYHPEHMTLLPFQLEPGAKLAQKAARGEIAPMLPEEAGEIYFAAKEKLLAAGYRAYTVTDFALPGHENRYRLLQLQGISKLGVGYHAETSMEGVTYSNGHSLAEYLEHPTEVDILANHGRKLDESAQLVLACLNGLSVGSGLDTNTLRKNNTASLHLQQILRETLPELQKLRYATSENGVWTLTPSGIAAGNTVRKMFYPKNVEENCL